MATEELITEQLTGFMSSMSTPLIIIGIFAMSVGIFVAGIKFMFWSFYEVDVLIKRWKNSRRNKNE